MKYKLILSSVLAFFFYVSYAQTSYPKGSYMSFEELKNKTPSNSHNVVIVERKNSEIKFNGGNDFKLVSPDKSIKKRILKKEIYAISDGENLYINCLLHKCQLWYAEVKQEGKFLAFKGAIGNGEAATTAALGGALGGAMIALKRYVYVLSMETGELTKLTNKTIPVFLSENKQLLEEYEQYENKKKLAFQLYLVNQLNELSTNN